MTDAVAELCEAALRSDSTAFTLAVSEAIDAINRLYAIRHRHNSLTGETAGGKPVYCSIHGHELHHLLFGDLDAERNRSGGDVPTVVSEGTADEIRGDAVAGLGDCAEADHDRDGGEVGEGCGEVER